MIRTAPVMPIRLTLASPRNKIPCGRDWVPEQQIEVALTQGDPAAIKNIAV